MKTYTIILVFLFIPGCMTTSDVQSNGDGTYRISSAACPACGGISKSQELAMAEASQFCESQGLMMVSEGLENRNLNAVGAGSSFLEFRCSDILNDDIMVACYEEGRMELIAKYGDERFTQLSSKMFPAGTTNFGISGMADNSVATPEQRELILDIGTRHETCQTLFVEAASNQAQVLMQSSLSVELENIVSLANGEITFGQYAKQFNSIANDYSISMSELESQELEQRRIEQTERRQGLNNLGTMFRGVNCTSTSLGSTVRTNCR